MTRPDSFCPIPRCFLIFREKGHILFTWLDLFLALGVALVLAFAGWFLLRMMILAPGAIPTDHGEVAAQTDNVLRQDAISHAHIGLIASISFLLLGPTSLISNPSLRGFFTLLLSLLALFVVSLATLFTRSLFKKFSSDAEERMNERHESSRTFLRGSQAARMQ